MIIFFHGNDWMIKSLKLFSIAGKQDENPWCALTLYDAYSICVAVGIFGMDAEWEYIICVGIRRQMRFGCVRERRSLRCAQFPTMMRRARFNRLHKLVGINCQKQEQQQHTLYLQVSGVRLEWHEGNLWMEFQRSWSAPGGQEGLTPQAVRGRKSLGLGNLEPVLESWVKTKQMWKMGRIGKTLWGRIALFWMWNSRGSQLFWNQDITRNEKVIFYILTSWPLTFKWYKIFSFFKIEINIMNLWIFTLTNMWCPKMATLIENGHVESQCTLKKDYHASDNWWHDNHTPKGYLTKIFINPQ